MLADWVILVPLRAHAMTAIVAFSGATHRLPKTAYVYQVHTDRLSVRATGSKQLAAVERTRTKDT